VQITQTPALNDVDEDCIMMDAFTLDEKCKRDYYKYMCPYACGTSCKKMLEKPGRLQRAKERIMQVKAKVSLWGEKYVHKYRIVHGCKRQDVQHYCAKQCCDKYKKNEARCVGIEACEFVARDAGGGEEPQAECKLREPARPTDQTCDPEDASTCEPMNICTRGSCKACFRESFVWKETKKDFYLADERATDSADECYRICEPSSCTMWTWRSLAPGGTVGICSLYIRGVGNAYMVPSADPYSTVVSGLSRVTCMTQTPTAATNRPSAPDSESDSKDVDLYYKLLGVEKTATDSDIKKAYRQKALEFHPDKLSHQSADEQKENIEKMKELTQAKTVYERTREGIGANGEGRDKPVEAIEAPVEDTALTAGAGVEDETVEESEDVIYRSFSYEGLPGCNDRSPCKDKASICRATYENRYYEDKYGNKKLGQTLPSDKNTFLVRGKRKEDDKVYKKGGVLRGVNLGDYWADISTNCPAQGLEEQVSKGEIYAKHLAACHCVPVGSLLQYEDTCRFEEEGEEKVGDSRLDRLLDKVSELEDLNKQNLLVASQTQSRLWDLTRLFMSQPVSDEANYGFKHCADQGGSCRCPGGAYAQYGHDGFRYRIRLPQGSADGFMCEGKFFHAIEYGQTRHMNSCMCEQFPELEGGVVSGNAHEGVITLSQSSDVVRGRCSETFKCPSERQECVIVVYSEKGKKLKKCEETKRGRPNSEIVNECLCR